MNQPPIPNRKYDSILRRVRDLPSLPIVVNNILELLGSPTTSAAEIAHLISYDPGLTSKFLRMVNSAAYGFQRQISSVQHAIMILGFSTVRGVVLSASIFRLFDGKKHHGIDPTEFWRHSIGAAIAARIMAAKWRIRYAEDAFTAGMLHDLGKIILDYYFAADYQQVIAEAKRQKLPFHGEKYQAIEQEILKIDHSELGYQLALRWKLPSTFSEAIRYHHNPTKAPDAPDLVHVVALANVFSNLYNVNYGVFNPEFIPQNLLDYFNIDEDNMDALENLFKQVSEEMEGIDDLLGSLRR